jgi:serine/threonine protein kinase
MSEIAILQSLKSPYIARILDVFEDTENIMIVQEFLAGTTLLEFAMTKHCPEKIVKNLMSGLIQGLHYLSENGVAHRDIKLENIMVTTVTHSNGVQEHVPKYIDFGLSKVLL